MTSEWTLSIDGEATASRRDDTDGQNGVIDLELFPDLQDLDKTPYSRSVSKESLPNNINQPEDDELLNYFLGGSGGKENGHRTLLSLAEDQLPARVSQKNNAVVGITPVTRLNTNPGGVVKVVTLRQGIVEGGKVLLVNETNRSKSDSFSNTRSNINTTTVGHNGPTSPCSSLEDSQQTEASLCMSKNAIAARENRQRKKQLIGNLENSVETLSTENSTLKTNQTAMKETIESLQLEVKYLRSVLANQSTLAKLLENIPMVPDLSLSKSVAIGQASNSYKQSSRKRSAPVDDAEALASDDECDCHPQKNVCMCSKENRYSKQRHNSDENCQPDHSYATETNSTTPENTTKSPGSSLKMRTRSQITDNDEMTGGVCLHVSGSSVSLEFCSSCSKQAANGKRRNLNKK